MPIDLYVRTHMPYIQAIIIYLFGHLLLIPTSICFRAKALLGVINLVSVSPYRAARLPSGGLRRRVRCVLDR